MCNNAQVREGKILGLPTEGAMVALSHMVHVCMCVQWTPCNVVTFHRVRLLGVS